jgi:hypothetical protein
VGFIFFLDGLLTLAGYFCFGIPIGWRSHILEGKHTVFLALAFIGLGLVSFILGRFFFISIEHTVLYPYAYR